MAFNYLKEMVLESLSIKELKSLCKQKGLSSMEYVWSTRPDIIRLLNSLEDPKEQERLQKVVAKVIRKNGKETEK